MSATDDTSPTTSLREVVLVTGISGSGKSVALHALEDAGFFCVDNLPPELLRDFLQLEHERLDRRVAIAVDVRSAGSLPHLMPLLQQLRGEGVAIQVVFLDASTDALVRRFSETRRPHPLSSELPLDQRGDREHAGEQCAGQSADAMDAEHVERIVIFEALFEPSTGPEADRAGDQTDQDAMHRHYEAGSGRDGAEPGHGEANVSNVARLAQVRPLA